MFNFITGLILASLLIPSGFNFFSQPLAGGFGIEQQINGPQRINPQNLGIKTTAKSILIIDDASGQILYDKNSAAVSSVASISKLMTALVILDTKPDWKKTITMAKADEREGGLVNLFADEQISTKDLFNIMLIASANEAAVALARNSGIKDFAAAMNEKARELGMTDSYFLEPSGLEKENVSTAADLIKLAKAAFARPEIIEALAHQEYDYQVINNKRKGKAVSTDKLLDSFLNQEYYQMIGAKTGYLDEAGYCLLISVKNKDSRRITMALLGAQTQPQRWQEAKGLVDWVYGNYVWR